MAQQKLQALEELGTVLDLESWNWLLMQHPPIAGALEAAIAAGANIEDVKMLAWSRTQRPEIVQRIVNAARWLEAQEEE